MAAPEPPERFAPRIRPARVMPVLRPIRVPRGLVMKDFREMPAADTLEVSTAFEDYIQPLLETRRPGEFVPCGRDQTEFFAYLTGTVGEDLVIDSDVATNPELPEYRFGLYEDIAAVEVLQGVVQLYNIEILSETESPNLTLEISAMVCHCWKTTRGVIDNVNMTDIMERILGGEMRISGLPGGSVDLTEFRFPDTREGDAWLEPNGDDLIPLQALVKDHGRQRFGKATGDTAKDVPSRIRRNAP